METVPLEQGWAPKPDGGGSLHLCGPPKFAHIYELEWKNHLLNVLF